MAVLVLASDQTADRPRVAETKCELTFRTETELDECIRQLRISDEQLKKRPPSEKLYTWVNVYREGMTLHFGVAWFDQDYFEKKKGVYTSQGHAELFRRFGATPNDFKITHRLTA